MILCEYCGGRENMNKEFLDAIEANPIIAAVKDEQGLQNCLGREELTVIFILYGDIRSIGNCGADPPGGEDRDGTYRPDHRFMFERGFCGLYLQKYPCRRDHFDKSIHDQQGEEAWNVYSSAFSLLIPWRSRILRIWEISMSSCRM